MNAIETKALTKYYGKSRGICGIDLTVAEGDFFGFIGPNGAGKSTTIRILCGLISASSGSAGIFGRDIRENRTEILSELGYLPSETAFYSGMTVRETLRLSAGLRKKDCKKQAELLCERLELDPSRKVGELSLGNRKKLGIVCAMQHEPRLYILDEPTSGLDPLMQREFYGLLCERNAEGATVMLSSHVLSEVGRYCRSAAIIREGKILACDTVERLGHTGAKRVIIRGAEGLTAPEGALDVQYTDSGLSFLYSGRADGLIRSLSRYDFDDISIQEPELEDVFMHYYIKEEADDTVSS